MDEFSIATAEEIFAAFPDWRGLARAEQADDGSSFMVVEVAPPVEADVEHGLVIHTANGEVTVGFDYYHSHFDPGVGDGEYFGTGAALQFVKQILEERVAVVSWWNHEQWLGSSCFQAGSSPESPTWTSNYNRVRVRSWKGTLNADIGA